MSVAALFSDDALAPSGKRHSPPFSKAACGFQHPPRATRSPCRSPNFPAYCERLLHHNHDEQSVRFMTSE